MSQIAQNWSEREKLELEQKILRISKKEGGHLVVPNVKTTVYVNRTTYSPRNLWWILKFGSFDFEKQRVESSCEHLECLSHLQLVSRRWPGFQNLTEDDRRRNSLIFEKFSVPGPPGSTCRLWAGHLDRAGYGRVKLSPGSKYYSVHRAYYQFWHRKNLSRTVYVCHSPICKNKHCFAIEHLSEGDAKKNNNEDRKEAETLLLGEKNPAFKHSEKLFEIVKVALDNYERTPRSERKTLRQIADECNAPYNLVTRVRQSRGKRSRERKKKVANPLDLYAKRKRKLTPEQVRECRKLAKTDNWSYSRLGERYGVKKHSIYSIVKGRGYKDVKETPEEDKKWWEESQKLYRNSKLTQLLERTKKEGNCMIWTGGKFSSGYGETCYENKNVYTHVLSYRLANLDGKKIPDGMVVSHQCSPGSKANPLCINPAHLKLESLSQNSSDMLRDGTCKLLVGGVAVAKFFTQQNLEAIKNDVEAKLSFEELKNKWLRKGFPLRNLRTVLNALKSNESWLQFLQKWIV